MSSVQCFPKKAAGTLGVLLALTVSVSYSQIGKIQTKLAQASPVAVGELEAVGREPGCTATLISWQTVLTAAHCVCPSETNSIGCATRGQFILDNVFPIDNPATPVDESTTRTRISIGGDVHVHPAYTQQGWLRRDFAVITLDQPVFELLKGIPPIFMDNTPVKDGDKLTVVGYGRTGAGCGSPPAGKRKVTLKVDEVVPDAIRFRNNSIYVCGGDSGGPAINARGLIVGVASHSPGGPVSTYRPVSEVYSWIAGIRDQVENDPRYREGNLVSAGTSWDLDAYRPLFNYRLPVGKTPADIVGMGIAGSNDHVYIWYVDGTVSSGTSWDLDAYRSPYQYSLPPGKTPKDIVGMGIAGSNDHVYVWYTDGMVSSGTSRDLDNYRPLYKYSLPPGRTSSDLTGLGIVGSNDFAFAWYRLRIL